MSKIAEAKRSAFKKMLEFVRKSPVNKFLVGYGAFFGLGLLVYLSVVSVIIPTYYAFAPARSFVDYYYARVADTPVGTEPQLTLCRRINYDNVKISAVRTFIKHENGTNQETVGEYRFDANVSTAESTGNCVNVRLKGQPQVAGTYSTSTSIEFYVGGHRKTYSYNSNQYKMTPVEQSDEDRIKDLQRQIDEIKSISSNSGTQQSAPQPAAPQQQQQVATVPTQPSQPVQQPQPQPQTPSRPSTPEPEPSNPGILGGINQLLRGLGL